MTVLKYLIDPQTGCCTTSELMALSRDDKGAMAKLKEYAAEEMKNRGIEITEK